MILNQMHNHLRGQLRILALCHAMERNTLGRIGAVCNEVLEQLDITAHGCEIQTSNRVVALAEAGWV